jgi:hypothetical protein
MSRGPTAPVEQQDMDRVAHLLLRISDQLAELISILNHGKVKS